MFAPPNRVLSGSGVVRPDPVFVDMMLGRNLDLYHEAKSLGSTRYPIGAVTFEQADWEEHFGSYLRVFRLLKRIHDPAGILTPGPGIFG